MKIYNSYIVFLHILALSASAQNDTIIDGSSLLNLKLAKPNSFYEYKLRENCFTYLKFRNGKLSDYYFNLENSFQVDTFLHTDKNGFAIQSKKNSGEIMNVIDVNNRDDLFYIDIMVKFDGTRNDNYFLYYANGQMASSKVYNPKTRISKTTKYKESGLKEGIEEVDSLGNLIYLEIYNSNGRISFKRFAFSDKFISELYKNGAIIQKDTINSENKFVGTVAQYYLNGNMKSATPYVNGKINGLKVEYYKNGMMKSKVEFVDDQKIK